MASDRYEGGYRSVDRERPPSCCADSGRRHPRNLDTIKHTAKAGRSPCNSPPAARRRSCRPSDSLIRPSAIGDVEGPAATSEHVGNGTNTTRAQRDKYSLHRNSVFIRSCVFVDSRPYCSPPRSPSANLMTCPTGSSTLPASTHFPPADELVIEKRLTVDDCKR